MEWVKKLKKKKKHYMKTKYVNIRISNKERDGARNKGRQVQPRPNCPTEPSPDHPRSRGEGKEEEDRRRKGEKAQPRLTEGREMLGPTEPSYKKP
jgi:hypothetical protein